MAQPPILILHSSGTNRDGDAAQAIRLAGGVPQIVHLNHLRRGDVRINDHAALLIPGGFSYADALGAGQRLALELRLWFGEAVAELVSRGKPVLGICNGFQALVRAGLLPGPFEPKTHAVNRQVTLTENANGLFECRWVTLRVEPTVRSSWLQPLKDTLIRCPVAHGEGRFVTSSDALTQDLQTSGLVAFRYQTPTTQPTSTRPQSSDARGLYPANPNGSVADIAGICDRSGAVVGLMPHPENHVFDWQRPHGAVGASGMALFEALVEAAK